MMAVRLSLSPPIAAFRCRLCRLRPSLLRNDPRLSCRFYALSAGGGAPVLRGRCLSHSLVESVLKELEAMRVAKRIRAASRELVEDKLEKWVLQKGLLLEFRKDAERILLGVAQKPDGKKNWMVHDQNGVTSSIKPQQVTFVVPGVENFDHSEISMFIQRAESLLDFTLLEYAWMELLEKKKAVTAEELAEIIYGSMDPLESYCAHLLLSKDEMYFSKIERKGTSCIYEPRPISQVQELLDRNRAKAASEKELEVFVQLLLSAKAMPPRSKPPRSVWSQAEKVQYRIKALEAYALDMCKSDEEKKTAGLILKAMGLPKMSSAAVNLLIDIGYFPVHVNLDLLKLNVRMEHPDEVLLAAENLLLLSSDIDKMTRKDLTVLKVYAIDVDEADELDDALSATRLQDGRIKVWIHVADPTSLVQPQSIVDREAMRRGTSIFLPTATYPMFPEKLAMEGMSLQQGKLCNAVSVSVVLHSDGSIAEYSIDNTIIRPTYMLTYESASELLHLNLEEEAELKILSEAAAIRLRWRREQGAIDTATIEPRVKVTNPDDPEPSINLYVEDQSSPAMRLVSEMMILCGEAVATYGSCNNIPLPYRGQPQSNISTLAFAHLPEGPVRSFALVKIMRAAELDFRNPVRHGVMGLPGYVQFTSPIRRYMDLVAHYQVKAFMRGDSLPLSAGQLEGISSLVNMHVRLARKLSSSSLRYWLLEFLRRQPKEKKYRALVLRFVKDRYAALLLIEVGIQASALVSIGVQVGDEVEVQVEEAHPRDDILSLKERMT